KIIQRYQIVHTNLYKNSVPSVRVLTSDTSPAVECEHMNLDNLLLTDLGSLPSSDKADNNNKKNEASEDGTENSNKKIEKSDTSSQKCKTLLHIQFLCSIKRLRVSENS
ncbi:hypothetical protein CIHG_10595, partial [Coccidioides immitis H538.4]